MTSKNRDILLNSSMVIEQTDEHGNEAEPITINLVDYADCVDSALKETDLDSLMTQLFDNISDVTGHCVVSADVETESLSF